MLAQFSCGFASGSSDPGSYRTICHSLPSYTSCTAMDHFVFFQFALKGEALITVFALNIFFIVVIHVPHQLQWCIK